ncbi:MAG: response regulator transcription factor [Actinobacteria bacterium]|nr:response regulator transcription factor [Actinomycetota bacterium]
MQRSAEHNGEKNPSKMSTNLRSGISAFRATLVHEARFGWMRWIGFATFLVWMFGLFWSGFFSRYMIFGAIDFLAVRSIWLGVEAMSLLAVFFMLGKWGDLLALKQVRFGAGVCTCTGTGIMIFAILVIQSSLLSVIGAIVVAVGSAFLLVLWGSMFARRGSQSLLFGIGFSFFIASGFDALLVFMPTAMQSVFVTIAPLVSIALYRSADNREQTSPQGPFVLDTLAFETEGASRSWRLLFLPLLVGISYGLMQRLVIINTVSSGAANDLLTISTFFIAGLISVATAVFFAQDRVLQFVYFLALPLMVTAFVLFPIFGSYAITVQAVFMVGFNYFYFMVWTFWAGAWSDTIPPLGRRFALGLFVITASESLGSMLGLLLIGFQMSSRYTLTIISLLVVYFLMMGALFSAGKFFVKNEAKKDSAPQAGALPDADRETFSETDSLPSPARHLADEYALSSREEEVLNLLVKGRNRAYISKTLYISDNTTRTHMRNIYRKLDVHSHQELLDLLDTEDA